MHAVNVGSSDASAGSEVRGETNGDGGGSTRWEDRGRIARSPDMSFWKFAREIPRCTFSLCSPSPVASMLRVEPRVDLNVVGEAVGGAEGG